MSSILHYEPFYELLDDSFGNPFHGRSQHVLRRGEGGESAVRPVKPRMDLHEDPDKNLVTATLEVPGMTKDNIEVNVQNGCLAITAENKQSSEYDESGWAIRERRFGKYSRILQLPAGVKEEEIKAKMENGLLSVTFPKTTPEQAPKRINIV